MSNRNFFWGIILILIGIIFLLDNLYIMDFGEFISTFWPVILILIGLKMINDKQRSKREDTNITPEASEKEVRIKGDRLNADNIFGDIIRNIVSDDFTGGSVDNIFGDIKIDLSEVKIKQQNCRLTLNGVFGDITVILPKGIPLKAKASAVGGNLLIKGTRRNGFLPELEYAEPGFKAGTISIYVQVGIVFGSVNIF